MSFTPQRKQKRGRGNKREGGGSIFFFKKKTKRFTISYITVHWQLIHKYHSEQNEYVLIIFIDKHSQKKKKIEKTVFSFVKKTQTIITSAPSNSESSRSSFYKHKSSL